MTEQKKTTARKTTAKKPAAKTAAKKAPAKKSTSTPTTAKKPAKKAVKKPEAPKIPEYCTTPIPQMPVGSDLYRKAVGDYNDKYKRQYNPHRVPVFVFKNIILRLREHYKANE